MGRSPARSNDRVTVDNFRKKCLRELTKIKTAWPGLKWSTAKGVLVIKPSKPLITAKEGEK